MFDLGIQEIAVVFIIALIVYGPKNLPEMGRTIGKYISMFKRMVSDVKRQVDLELYEHNDPIKAEIEKINREAMESMQRPQPEATPDNPAPKAEKSAPEAEKHANITPQENPKEGIPIHGK
ncbi:MAG: twin-arginine translocase subunit TatB [Nitrospirae bacterium]|nr:twin-arginine translocase subunit TatB [Nitrospirota bacterium]